MVIAIHKIHQNFKSTANIEIKENSSGCTECVLNYRISK